MPDEQQTIHDPAQDIAVQAPETLAYEPIEEEQDGWAEEPEELPARPRRRLVTPIPLALLGVLLIAGGFIAGVQVQKGESSSSASTGAGATAGLASRFAALRGGTSSTGSSAKAPSGAAGGFPGTGAGATRPTSGTVAYLDGSTLYVTSSEGNTVKVKTSPSTGVTKTVKTKVKGIYPGETVTVTGATGSNGTVSAESISVGLAAAIGASGTSGTGGGGSGGSGAAALFGSG
jgi:hypothetical protein